ncbi:MAG: acyl-CoA dehydrogenase family protein [Hyphomicrobiaceae bacterium]|nr:acyl-CoA dehydrogenase family protein [Hyphomicrobiaceae bacterium]
MQKRFPIESGERGAALLAAVESVREVAERHAEEAEAKGTLPAVTVEALEAAGLFALKLPRELGGVEADPFLQFEVLEALSAIDPSAGWSVMIGGTGIGLPGAFLSEAAVAEIFPSGRIPRGAIVSMPTGEAVPVDGGYRLTGRWSFVSGVPHAEWVTVGAKVVRSGGSEPELRLLTLPAPSVHIHDNWHVAGLKGTGSCDVSVKGQLVAEHFTWDRLQSPQQRGGPLYRLGHPGFVANEHAAFAIGVGRGALETVMALARSKRRSFRPSPSSLESRATFQRFVGLADLRLRAARSLVLELYAEAWEIARAGTVPPPPLQSKLRSVTAFATEVAAEVTTEAFRFAGGEAVYGPSKLQRYLRDINVAAQHLMVSSIAYENHGQFALGLPSADPLR